MIEKLFWLIVLLVTGLLTMAAHGQSSSLYADLDAPRSVPQPQRHRLEDRLSPGIATLSLSAVSPPQPRFFAVHDLITVIVRESTTATSDASLETEKKSSIRGEISDFPNLRLDQLLQLQLQGGQLTNPPRVGMRMDQKWEGDGSYQRKDSLVTRLTARVIDVKPNGTLVLEARKFIQSDREELDIVLTGTCRAEDVAADNTVLSTQLYDLRVVKEHKGELRKATKKGILTRVFETIFNF